MNKAEIFEEIIEINKELNGEDKYHLITQLQANKLLDLVKNVWIFGNTTNGCVSVGWKEARDKLLIEIEDKPTTLINPEIIEKLIEQEEVKEVFDF